MRHLFILFLLPITVFCQEEISNFNLDKKQKFIDNYSFCLDDNSSVHYSIFYDKNDKESKARVVFVEDDKSIDVGIILFPENPKVLTSHIIDRTIYFTVSFDEERLKNTVFSGGVNVDTKEALKISRFFRSNDFYALNLRCKNKGTYFLTIDPDISVISFEDFNNRNKSLLEGKDVEMIFKDYEKLDLISYEEYIDKGPSADLKVYVDDDSNMVVTREIYDDNKTILFQSKLTKPANIQTDYILSSLLDETKHQNSFVVNGMLFQSSSNRNLLGVNIYDILKRKFVKEIKIDEKGTDIVRNFIFKGDSISNKDINFKRFLNGFYAAAIGNSYNPQMVVSVNRNSTSGYILKVGHVDKNIYSYQDFWFQHWFMQNQFFMQQQMFNNFGGPNPYDIEFVFKSYANSYKNHMVVILDNSLNFDEIGSIESVAPSYNYLKTIDNLNKDYRIDNKSYSRQNDFLLVNYFNKKYNYIGIIKVKAEND
jgi:hypothetical protein